MKDETKPFASGLTAFQARLHEAIRDARLSLSPTAFTEEFNLRTQQKKVTVHAVRKWLVGDSYPVQERLTEVARMLNVSPQWLRYGESGTQPESETRGRIPHEEVLLLADYRKLNPGSKIAVRDLIKSLLRNGN